MTEMQTGFSQYWQIGSSIHPGVLIGSALWNLMAACKKSKT
jgi:hypothetical protein